MWKNLPLTNNNNQQTLNAQKNKNKKHVNWNPPVSNPRLLHHLVTQFKQLHKALPWFLCCATSGIAALQSSRVCKREKSGPEGTAGQPSSCALPPPQWPFTEYSRQILHRSPGGSKTFCTPGPHNKNTHTTATHLQLVVYDDKSV